MSKVTAYISTKDRYFTSLPMAIESILLQTRPPEEFILFDDGAQKDLRQDVNYAYLFSMMGRKGIGIELKESYYKQAQKHLEIAEHNIKDKNISNQTEINFE